jgi:hypothetical protein
MEETKLNIKNSKSSLFLMELIIVIMFFALASGNCIQLFAKAHQITKATTVEQQAMMITDSVITCIKQRPNDLEWIASQFNGEILENDLKEDKIVILLDDLLKPIEVKSTNDIQKKITPCYQLTMIKTNTKAENYKIEIIDCKTKQLIYQQEIVCHQAIGK